MSKFGQKNGVAYPRQPNDRYFTPPSAVAPFLAHAASIGLLARGRETWECAAGAGHIARTLAQAGRRVLATDIAPDENQIHPVVALDFLSTQGLGGGRFDIVTNPPYGPGNALAVRFLEHALAMMDHGLVALALLLPFEFDSRGSRTHLVGEHPCFAGKVTLARRVRWINLPQKKSGPMGHHSWFLWTAERKVQLRARSLPMMVTR